MNFYEDFQSRKKKQQEKDKLYKEVMQYVPENASMIVRNEVDKAYGDKETYSAPKELKTKEVPFQSQKAAQSYSVKQAHKGIAVGKLPTVEPKTRIENTNRFEKRFDKSTRPTEQTFRPLNPNNVYLNPKITPERMMRYGVRPQHLPINPKPTANSSGGIKGKFQRNVFNPMMNSIFETQINREWAKEENRDRKKIAELEKMKGKFYVPQSKGLFQTAIQGASGLGGQQLDQARSAIPTALAFAGGALALGQAGPQVALPEEAVTVPTAFATGLKVGVAKSAYQSEKGASYREQIESGVDPKKASYISTGVGAVNAGLEFIQFDKLLKGFKFAKAMNDVPAMKQIGLEIAKRTGDIAKETGQEVLQEGVSIAGANIGKKLSGIELDSKEDVKNRLKDTAVSSALSFGLMGVPGTVGSINNMARTPIQSSTQSNVNPIVTERMTQNTIVPNESKKVPSDGLNVYSNTKLQSLDKLANTPQNLRQYEQSNNQANRPFEYETHIKPEEISNTIQNDKYVTQNVEKVSMDEQRISDFAQRLVKSDTAPKVQFIETNQPGINGYYENGTIFINRNSSNPIANVFAHEFTHHLQESKTYNDFRNFTINHGLSYAYGHNDIATLIQEKQSQYSNAGINLSVTDAENELMAEYVEKYLLSDEKAINELARQNESLFYRIYAHIRDSIKLITGSEEEQFLIEARRKYAKAIRNLANERRVDLRKYSIQKDNDGGEYVYVDEPIIGSKLTNKKKKKVISALLKQSGNSHVINANGQEIHIADDLANEYTNSKSTYFSTEKNVRADKFKSANNVDEMIKIAQNERFEKNRKSTHNKDAKYGFYYYDTRFAVPKYDSEGNVEKKIYSARLVVRHDADGKLYLYDVDKIKKENTPANENNSSALPPKSGMLGHSLDDNVPQEKSHVNNKTKKTYSLDTSQIKNRSFQNTVQAAPSIHEDFARSIQHEVDSGTFAYEVIHDRDSLARVNHALEQNGLDKYLYSLESKLNEGKHLTKDDIVMGQRLIQEYIKLGDSEKAMYAVTLTAEAGTQAGQMVQAMSMMRRLTPEGQLMALNRITQKLTNEYVKPGEKEITVSKERAKDIMMSDTPERLEQAVERAKEDVYNQVPVTMMDKINAWRYLSMLGNLKTHGRNVSGNAVFYPTRMIKNQIARGLESAFIKGEKTKSFLTYKDKGLIELGKYDYDLNESTIKGESKYADSKMMYNRQIFNNKVLESIREFNFEWLEKEDNFFIKKVYANSFAGYLKANGVALSDVIDFNGNIKEGNTIIDNARRYATIEAQKATYRDESAIANWLTRQFKASKNDTLSQARNKAIGRFAVEAIIPFKKTPINVLKRGVEYSPVGLMDSLTMGMKQLKAGEITGTDLCDRISAGLTGTTLVGLGYALAHFGVLKGRGDEEKEKEKAFSKLTGQQNYSVNIGDSSYTIDWVSPTALPLFVGVEAFEELNKENDKKNFDIVNSLGTALDVIGNVSDPVFSMSMVQGLTRTMKSYSSNDGGFVFDFLSNAMSQYAGQYVPTAWGQFNRTMYATRYDTSSSRKGNAKVMQQTFNQVVSKVPFAPPHVLQPKIDVWGQEMLQEGDTWPKRLVQNMISPGYYSNTKRGTREDEIFRLYQKNGNTDVLPPRIDTVNEVTIDGETYTFNSKQRTQFLKTSGTYRKDLLDSLFSSESYKKASDEEKEKMIYNVYDYANQKAKSEIAKEFGTSYTPKGWIEKADSVGVNDYLQYKGVVGSLPDNEKGKSHKLKALSELGLSDEKTIAILKADFDEKEKSYSALVENGISIDDYLTVEEVRENMRVPLNRNGNPITKGPYSKKAQTFRYINSLNLEPYQKKLLFEMNYDKK